jgi:hypothetical protein
VSISGSGCASEENGEFGVKMDPVGALELV